MDCVGNEKCRHVCFSEERGITAALRDARHGGIHQESLFSCYLMDLLAAYQPRALAYASYTASVGSPVSTPSMVSCQVGGSASPDSTQAA